ncbi:F0F1 ATP synthase subunit B [Helicobacter himalayensis]|uniref:F0F1 ATP synthase subunit B n=1 Tax=Helicobacter himalayensis TaxID=1591088 RepID=UPI003D6FE5A0
MKKIFLLSLFCLIPSFAFASGGFAESDFIQRLINFVLFVAILWYFTASRIKAIFVARRESILSQLEEVQTKLNKAKQEKESVLRKLEESKLRAEEIIQTAKKEAVIASQRLAKQTQLQIQAMESSAETNMEFERISATRESVREVLEEVLHSKDIVLENTDYVNIITKRIA